MNEHVKEVIRSATGASEAVELGTIQSLWSGYGEIVRFGLKGADCESVIVKHVRIPEHVRHPRGWRGDLSHQRKLKSYEVETAWYGDWSPRCDDACRVPHCLALETHEDDLLIVLEDLDAAGFAVRRSDVNEKELSACLSWLAYFHATFMGEEPVGLWASGTYWHLETRPEELEVLDDRMLRDAAAAIDEKLKHSRFHTLVHGDAKLANFCFSEDGENVAAVDFQYVGGGCGMKDLAYFMGSCLCEDECERQETALLDIYFGELRVALGHKGSPIDPAAVERDWRALYPVAWTDFHRFLKGWSPGHWKIHSYSERVAKQVVAQLNGESV